VGGQERPGAAGTAVAGRLGRTQSQRQFIRLITDAKLALVCSLRLLSNILAFTRAAGIAAAFGDYRITHRSPRENSVLNVTDERRAGDPCRNIHGDN